MKRSIVLLAAGIVLVMLGCNTDDAVAPSLDAPHTTLAKARLPGQEKVIALEGVLRVPREFNSFVGIKGSIEVSSALQQEGVMRHFGVKTTTFGALFPLDAGDGGEGCGWEFYGQEKDVVKVKSTALLEKAYLVAGRPDKLVLHISLQFDRAGDVELVGMKLTNDSDEIANGER